MRGVLESPGGGLNIFGGPLTGGGGAKRIGGGIGRFVLVGWVPLSSSGCVVLVESRAPKAQ